MSELSADSLLIQVGQVWWVSIRWADSPDTLETRPAVIVGWSAFTKQDDQNIIVASITSHSEGGSPKLGEIKIPNPKSYDLTENSHIRARNLTSIHPNLLTPKDNGPICTLDTALTIATITEISKLFAVQGFARAR